MSIISIVNSNADAIQPEDCAFHDKKIIAIIYGKYSTIWKFCPNIQLTELIATICSENPL